MAASPPSTTSVASPRPTCWAAIDPAKYRVTPIGISTTGEWSLGEAAQRALAAGPGALPARLETTGPSVSVTDVVAPTSLADAADDEVTVVLPLAARPDGRGRHRAGAARADRRRLRRVRRARLGPGDGQGDGQAGARRQRHPAGPLPGAARHRDPARSGGGAGGRARSAVLRQAVEHGLVGRGHQGPRCRRARSRPSTTP